MSKRDSILSIENLYNFVMRVDQQILQYVPMLDLLMKIVAAYSAVALFRDIAPAKDTAPIQKPPK